MSETTSSSGGSFEWPAQGDHIGAMRGASQSTTPQTTTNATPGDATADAPAEEYVTGEAVTVQNGRLTVSASVIVL